MKQQRVQYWDSSIYWFFNDKLHRDGDLPSIYRFYNGKLYSVVYCQHNKYHRTTGPTVIDYEFKNKWYFYHGKQRASLEEIQMLKACS